MQEQELIIINGEEGGGQIMRSALSLSILSGAPFRIINIRKGRPKPGLQPQHLESLLAAQKISNANVSGDMLNSTTITFAPAAAKNGTYEFRIKTAGSISLLLHAVYLPLAFSSGISEILFQGGTHVAWSPTFNYLQDCWLWFMKKIGLHIDLKLIKPGFYPHGGGLVKATIFPAREINPLNVVCRGNLLKVKIYSAHSNLHDEVAHRQADTAYQILASFLGSSELISIQCESLPSLSRNTTIALTAIFENSVCCFTELGEKGKPAEKVAADACTKLIDFLQSDAVVDEYMSDQLLLPLACNHASNEFTCNKLTSHLKTNLATINKFFPVSADIQQLAPYSYKVMLGGKWGSGRAGEWGSGGAGERESGRTEQPK